ncbi:MAG: Flp pilus assembly protein CpaB [Acidimicrobiia bacterium]|nr:Flp pilus assembly protein CpaB [Acidimicrobiia bacterium]MDH3396255.1 Flp pilus assembly protein CpaB [Acidimicrobiia bacterium]
MGRRTLVLIVALLLAGIAAFAVWQFLSNVEEEKEAELVLRAVYRVSGGTITEGTEGSLVLSQERAVASEEETRFLPENAIGSLEQLTATLTGRVAAGPISNNSILTTEQWVELTADIKPLAERIPEGKQAITIGVDNIQGVNGFIEAGDRINVIVTLTAPIEQIAEDVIASDTLTAEELRALQDELEQGIISRFVLQGLPVLAVGSEIRADEEADQTVTVTTAPVEGGEAVEQVQTGVLTLEVTPEEAERIVYTFSSGTVWLTLVPEDFVPVATDGITRDNLFDTAEELGQ